MSKRSDEPELGESSHGRGSARLASRRAIGRRASGARIYGGFAGLPWWVWLPTMAMAGLAVQYWLVGVQPALDLVFAILGLSHPVDAEGLVSSPAFLEFRTSFVQHGLSIGIHYVCMPVALLAGGFQFSARLRRLRPRLHRTMGMIYVVTAFIGIGGVLYKVVYTDLYGGILSQYQFVGMGSFVLICIGMGIASIRRGDLVAHRAWMLRGYWIMWSSAIVSRFLIVVWLPGVWATMDNSPEAYTIPYNIALFFSWAFALLAADLWLHIRPTARVGTG